MDDTVTNGSSFYTIFLVIKIAKFLQEILRDREWTQLIYQWGFILTIFLVIKIAKFLQEILRDSALRMDTVNCGSSF